MKESNLNLRERTKQFALRVIRLFCALPKTTTAQVLGKQLLRSGTSVGAQDREAGRSRSRAEFISKVESALPELDESISWMELLVEAGIVASDRLADLLTEANELTAIFVASAKTARKRLNAER